MPSLLQSPLRSLLAFALVVLFSACGAIAGTPPPDDVTAFVGVSVLPMDGTAEMLANQTVLVRGTRIIALGPADEVAVPDGAVRIEGAGKYLMPGLAEMHGHLLPPNASQEELENVLFLYLANGITTVRVMLGFGNSLSIREKTASGELLGPTFYMSGPSFNGGSIASPAGAEAKVRQQWEDGWDILKIHPGLTRAEYDAMAMTAHEVGIRFGGHVPAEVGLIHALQMGQDSFDHIDGYMEYAADDEGVIDDAKLAEAVLLTKQSGAAVVPTMALWEYLYGAVDPGEIRAYEELKYMPDEQVNSWFERYNQQLSDPALTPAIKKNVVEGRLRVLRELHEAGVPVLMGTDSPQLFSVPGFSLHRELERMAAAGMTNYDILHAGTYNVGEYFNGKDTFGTVGVGRRADLVLLDRNPLEDLGHLQSPAGVMARGRWLSAADINARLTEIGGSSAQ